MVTDEQVRRLRKLSNTEKNQEIAASKAGMDPTTARRYLGLERLPSELKKERPWRTREDPFGEVWDAVQRQVEESPGLEAKTLFEWLQREYPGRFSDGQIRTLQRRIKRWRVTEGPAQEVYFGQKHTQGRLCASGPHTHDPKKSSTPRALNMETITIVQHEQRRGGRSGSPAG